MALTNLVKEMAAAKVTKKMLAEKHHVHPNTIANRLSGTGNFTVSDAFEVQKTFFPNLGIEYLFKQS